MTLVLDPDIRDWVVLPLFVIIILSSLIRQSVSNYMNVATQQRVPIPLHVLRVQSLIASSSYLRLQYKSLIANHIITSSQQLHQYITFRMALLRHETTYLQSLKDAGESNTGDGTTGTSTASPPVDPMMDMMMKNPMSMMGNNMIFMVQNMVMMQGIQHFFSGFILLQVPFSLTIGFKSMFQKGVVDLPNLSSSYVSSVSWYFLVLYGLRSFLSLLNKICSYNNP
jgi:ER membrane protein complex subunit 3